MPRRRDRRARVSVLRKTPAAHAQLAELPLPSRGIDPRAAAGIEIEAEQRRLAMKITAQGRDVVMPRVRQIRRMVALSFAGVLVLAGVPDALAQKKLSYAEAFARCKADLDRTFPSGSQSTAGRNSRGGACMKQFWYNLKKSDNF
jgi:hypothetical protein